MNPWRYAYPGTNNPGSYDLWVQLDIAGNTNLICNWTKQVQINNTRCPEFFMCARAKSEFAAGRPVAWSLTGTTARGVRAWWCGWN